MNIIDIIQQKYNALTKKQREIANYLMENPADICYVSISGLCERTGCSPVTILKFCKAIGFPNFIKLKEAFRDYNQSLVNQFSVSTYNFPKGVSQSDLKIPYLNSICQEELDAIMNFYQHLDLKNVWDIATQISSGKIIYIFAHDAPRTLTLFLKNRLDILNLNSVLVDLADMKAVEYVLKQVSSRDMAILFSYPNYYYSVASVAGQLCSKECSLFLLSDSPECPAAPYAKHSFYCETRTRLFQNSWTLPLILLNLITSTLALILEDRGN